MIARLGAWIFSVIYLSLYKDFFDKIQLTDLINYKNTGDFIICIIIYISTHLVNNIIWFENVAEPLTNFPFFVNE